MPCRRFQALYKIREPFTIFTIYNRTSTVLINSCNVTFSDKSLLVSKLSSWMWSIWRNGNGEGLMMKRCEEMTRCYNCLWEFLMRLNVADRMSQHSTYVSWSMAKGNSRSCTDNFKLPLLSHLYQTFVTSCFKTWRKSSYNVHCKRKCSHECCNSSCYCCWVNLLLRTGSIAVQRGSTGRLL